MLMSIQFFSSQMVKHFIAMNGKVTFLASKCHRQNGKSAICRSKRAHLKEFRLMSEEGEKKLLLAPSALSLSLSERLSITVIRYWKHIEHSARPFCLAFVYIFYTLLGLTSVIRPHFSSSAFLVPCFRFLKQNSNECVQFFCLDYAHRLGIPSLSCNTAGMESFSSFDLHQAKV